MSAIWGAINLNGKAISKKEIESLKSPFDRCVIDRTEELLDRNCYMGCGIQYFTEEAKREKLPLSNQDNSIFFNADVMIDNREELYHKLQLTEKEKMLPDGMLQYRMFHTYGKESLNDMLGAYAFVYYDRKNEKISMVLDAVGNRCVYYMVQDGVVYYSSLIQSLINIKKKVKVNGEWMSDFLVLDYLVMFTEDENTQIEGIFRVAPAQLVDIKKDDVRKYTYWDPGIHRKEIKYKNDESYKREFRSIYKKAVTCVMRTNESPSILLSGGLDSTSVACIASRELKKSGKKLHSYTSVPIKGYKSEYSSNDVVDESLDVLKTKDYLGNLECSFIDLNGVNIWKATTNEMNTLEMPYKAFENLLWIEEAMKQAYKINSRILLTGFFGNGTVSYGDSKLYLETLLKRGKLIQFRKEFNQLWRKEKFSRKTAFKILLKDCFYTNKDSWKTYRGSYIYKHAAEKYNCNVRVNNLNKMLIKGEKSYKYDRIQVCNRIQMRQSGEIQTKFSLETGVIQRDPTKDKRVIEFCINLPIEQFSKNAEERRLITCYLRDIMPNHVFNLKRKGMQSADLKYRLSLNWDEEKREWITIYKENLNNEFIDCKKAIHELEQVESIKKVKTFDLIRHMYTILCLEYMCKLKTE